MGMKKGDKRPYVAGRAKEFDERTQSGFRVSNAQSDKIRENAGKEGKELSAFIRRRALEWLDGKRDAEPLPADSNDTMLVFYIDKKDLARLKSESYRRGYSMSDILRSLTLED